MPSDETRRVLKLFGVAVTAYEDALEAGAPAEEVDRAAAELDRRLREVTALIDRLRGARG
jgi:hypothetical protein